MQLSWQHFVGGVGLVFAAMIAWFGALWLNLQGANLWVFRLCIFLLLALAVAAIVWWLRNRQKTKPAGGTSSGADSASGAGVAEDILLVLREAEARVASSTQLPSGTRLSSLPVIFLVGDSAAGKTCVATQSGLEPELLSGQVYQEGNRRLHASRLSAMTAKNSPKPLVRKKSPHSPAPSALGSSRFLRLSELVSPSTSCSREQTVCHSSTIFSAT